MDDCQCSEIGENSRLSFPKTDVQSSKSAGTVNIITVTYHTFLPDFKVMRIRQTGHLMGTVPIIVSWRSPEKAYFHVVDIFLLMWR